MGSTIPSGRWLRGIAAALLCLLLGACSSTTQFFYERLDLLLPWYLGRYVDLDAAQAEQFDAQVEALLDWHRREELPRYADLLDDMLGRLDAPVTAGDVAAVSAAAEAAWYRLRNRALDELLLLGARLDEEQIADFIARLEEKQEDYERRYLRRDDEEYREDARDRLRDNLEDYVGRLDPAQRERVTAAAAALVRSDRLWLAERQRWIDTVRTALERRPGWEARLREEVLNWESRLDAQSTAAYEHNTRSLQTAVADVVDSRSPRQDARLRRKLSRLRRDFLELNARAGT